MGGGQNRTKDDQTETEESGPYAAQLGVARKFFKDKTDPKIYSIVKKKKEKRQIDVKPNRLDVFAAPRRAEYF